MRPTSSGRRRRRGDEGDVEVFVGDEQSEVAVDVQRWATLAREVLTAEGVSGDAELSLLFVDEVAIADLNVRFLGGAGPTDVLSFPLEDDLVESGRVTGPEGSGPHRDPFDAAAGPLLLGDVVICPAVAERNAPQHAGTLDDELALLVVHGILHVLGMDHAEPDEAVAMRTRERELLERFHGPVRAGTEIPTATATPSDTPSPADTPSPSDSADESSSP